MSNYTIHFDGSCWPNPGGVAAYGYTIDLNGLEIKSEAGLCTELDGETSNNVAEFYALYKALQALPEIQPGDQVLVRGDSLLVINIMNRMWRPSAVKLYYDAYKLAYNETEDLHTSFGIDPAYTWVPREDNTRCDDLSKEHNKAPK